MATSPWVALPNTGLGEPLVRQDPQLAIADACDFVDHGGNLLQPWPVSIEVDHAQYRPSGVKDLQINVAHAGSAFFTALATRAAIAALAKDNRVRRILFAAPQVPQRPWPRWPLSAAPAALCSTKRDGKPPSRVLLGVIDDGCPFAHPDLLRPDGELRVLRLWNQDSDPSAGPPPAGFSYGAEFSRADLHSLRMAARSAGGSVDFATCYRAAGMPRLQHRFSHGAQVLGLLAGRLRWRGATRPKQSLVQMIESGESARDADIAFVQLPQTVLQSVSVPALEHHAYDAVRYLCNLAATHDYQQLVIVLAYESWIGSHDGTSWFEQALDTLLNPARSAPRNLNGLRTHVVLPAGNSRQRSAHAYVASSETEAELHWHVPPGHEVPTLLELWAPLDAAGIEVRVTPPGGVASPWLAWGTASSWGTGAECRACALMHPSSPGSAGRPQLALRIAPTAPWRSRVSAPHGVWTLSLRGSTGALNDLHARIGRTAPALRGHLQVIQPHFIQRTAEEAGLDRLHTLNGHACGIHVTVAGASLATDYPYVNQPAVDNRGRPRRFLLPGDPAGLSQLQTRSAAYSGSGPTEGRRTGPDSSIALEESGLWAGVLSPGTSSASVVRLSGTSASAPLLARWSVTPPSKVTKPTPNQTQAPDDPAMGARVIEP
jgi:hypothetical protein